jgi:hypothetical protein
VRASINGDTAAYENVTFELTGFSSTGPGGGGGGAYDTFWITDDKTGDDAHDVQQDGQTVNLKMGTFPTADGARVEYSVNNTVIGEVSPDRDFTNSDGRNTTTLTVKKNGSIKIYTSSGGSGDDLNVTVENFPSQAVVYNNDAAAYDIDGGGGGPTEAVNFSITNTGGNTVRITDMVIESPAATKLLEGSTSSPWDSEVRIDSNDGGFANEGNAYSLGNSIAAYEDEGDVPNDLTAGETATVYMHKFLDDESNQVDMDGKQVTTTFSFQNRDPVSFTFTPTRPPTVFNSLTADATFQGQGNSGQIDTIDFNGSINNPDTNGVVRIAVIEGSDSNNNSVNMAGSFDINNVDTATGSTDEVDIVAELVNNDGDAYQTCQATLNQASDPLSLADFSCTTGPAQ